MDTEAKRYKKFIYVPLIYNKEYFNINNTDIIVSSTVGKCVAS